MVHSRRYGGIQNTSNAYTVDNEQLEVAYIFRMRDQEKKKIFEKDKIKKFKKEILNICKYFNHDCQLT